MLVAAEVFADAARLTTWLRPHGHRGPVAAVAPSAANADDRSAPGGPGASRSVPGTTETVTDGRGCEFRGRRYYCFKLGNWERGLGFLARGSDPGTRDLATLELSKPTKTEELVRLGNGWWDFGRQGDEDSQRQGHATRGNHLLAGVGGHNRSGAEPAAKEDRVGPRFSEAPCATSNGRSRKFPNGRPGQV